MVWPIASDSKPEDLFQGYVSSNLTPSATQNPALGRVCFCLKCSCRFIQCNRWFESSHFNHITDFLIFYTFRSVRWFLFS